MEEGDEYGVYETKQEVKFNLAIDTLRRLGLILEEIKRTAINPNIPREVGQEMRINLMKQFYIQSSPMIDKEMKEKYQPEIFSFSPHFQKVTEGTRIKTKIVFSPQLDKRIYEILVELQEHLQDKGMFMPPKDEDGDMF